MINQLISLFEFIFNYNQRLMSPCKRLHNQQVLRPKRIRDLLTLVVVPLFYLLLIATSACNRPTGEIINGDTLHLKASHYHHQDNSFLSHLLLEAFDELSNQVESKHVQLYSDTTLTTILDSVTFKDVFFTKVKRQIINPLNPDDPYDLVDTLIPAWRLHDSIQNIRLGHQHVQLFFSDKKIWTLKKVALGKHQFLVEAGCVPKKKTSIDTFKLQLQSTLNDTKGKLFTALLTSDCALYYGSKLSKEVSAEDRKWSIFWTKERAQFIIEPNTEPYNVIDSVFLYPPNYQWSRAICFSTKLVNSNLNYSLKPMGISFLADSLPAELHH